MAVVQPVVKPPLHRGSAMGLEPRFVVRSVTLLFLASGWVAIPSADLRG